jgi:hypothetical protein
MKKILYKVENRNFENFIYKVIIFTFSFRVNFELKNFVEIIFCNLFCFKNPINLIITKY